MRNFWISYRAPIKGGHIEGDVVADMPDDGKLTAEWLKHTRDEIRLNLIDKMAENIKRKADLLQQPQEPVPYVGQVILLAVIPLEG